MRHSNISVFEESFLNIEIHACTYLHIIHLVLYDIFIDNKDKYIISVCILKVCTYLGPTLIAEWFKALPLTAYFLVSVWIPI